MWFLVVVASELNLVQCSGQAAQPATQLLVNSPSSGLVEGAILHTFQPSTGLYQLIHDQEDCPRGTLALGPGGTENADLVLVTDITFNESTAEPTCIKSADSAIGFTSIQAYKCLVVMDGVTVIPLTINIQPEFLSTAIMFPRTFYDAWVVEGQTNATLTTAVGLFAVTSPRMYMLVPSYQVTGVFSHLFHVTQQQTGCTAHPVIHTTQELDTETQSYFEVTIEARATYAPDMIAATTVVGVRVLDVNDNPPEFTGSPDGESSLTVLAGGTIPPGTRVARYQTTDTDSGINGETLFSLNTTTLYTAHPLSGEVYTFQPLTPAQQTNSTVFVEAQDLGDPVLISPQAPLMVFIHSAESSTLELLIHDSGQQLYVTESTSTGDQVTTISLTGGSGDPVELSLTIATLGPCECFRLADPIPIAEGLQYSLQVAAALDFESTPSGQYRVLLTASDTSVAPPLTTTLELLVEVGDENEAPSFPVTGYWIDVIEGTPVGTNIGQAQAGDPDNGSNGTLTYSLINPSPPGLLEVDAESGLIYTMAALDYEVLTSAEVTVVVQDGGGLNSTTVITVTVTDRNDLPPSFLGASVGQTVTVTEDHPTDTPIFQFVALDEDSGCNGAVEYTIVHADPDVFSVGVSSGLLFPAPNATLDYEAFQSADVIVRVTDLGEGVSYSIDTTLRVLLTDVDDEVPVLDPIGCPCFIVEETAQASCPSLSAYDPDSPDLTYEISSGGGALFQIESTTGVVSIQSALDREEASVYELEVTVSDGTNTSPPVVLNVVVMDINDNAPEFSGGTATITAPSDLPPGGLVGRVAASDADVGYNALTEHTITDSSVLSTFRLDPLTGELYSIAPLTNGMYSFSVSARNLLPLTNGGSNQATIFVTIQVSGLVNTPPTFALTTEYRTVAENLPISSDVVQLVAVDENTGADGTLTYSLVADSGNHSDFFQVNPNGMVTVARSLSGRAGDVYVLNVSASDSTSVAYQQLLVSVFPNTYRDDLSYNINVPVCAFSGSVEEELDSPTLVTQLTPTQDTMDIRYSIVTGDASSAFRIGTSGASLEALGGFSNVFSQTEVVFVTLLAEYGSFFHFCTVTVAIEDINNNPPFFDTAVDYTFQLYDQTPVGSGVYQVTANDADVGTNAVTLYTISNSDSIPFEIDESTGVVSVAGDLDQPDYTFTVTATDAGMGPAATASVMVTAVVLATPNSSPVFTSPMPLTISELARGVVSTLRISDADGETNQQAANTFCIASGNLRDSFRVTRLGELVAMDTLDYESLPSQQLVLTVIAYDGSPNTMSTSTPVTVTLMDENEPPLFSVPVYRVSIPEDAAMGSPVITVTATDSDAGENGNVTYSMPSDDSFVIDTQTGAITTARNLNRNNQPVRVFTVTATDGGSPSTSSSAQVHVSLTDVNNIAPAFSIGGTLTLAEDTEVGSEVLLLTATDDDVGINALLLFTIQGGNDERRFSLNPWTGSLTLVQSLDVEAGDTQYTLDLLVQDNGIPSLSSSPFQLVVDISDSNDHHPVFTTLEYECYVLDTMRTQFQETCQVSASDLDQTGNEVSYSLNNALFAINPSSGVITVATSLPLQDRIDEPAFIFQVAATDSHSEGTRTSVAIVTVMLVDSNSIPVMESGGAQLSFYEDTPVNTLLFFAHAHDQDVLTELSTVTYGISGSGGQFRVETESGGVFLDSPFDAETSPLDISIIASNSQQSGRPSTSISYRVSILQRNRNTLPPQFHPDQNPSGVWVSRSSPPGTHVVELNATDPEEQALQYNITGGSGVGYFQIDSVTGEVTTAFSLMSVDTSQLTLVIRALDHPTSPLPGFHELVISLSSGTSSKPFFSRPVFTANPSEGASGVITGVRAAVDSVVETSLCYSILSGDLVFDIDQQTGAISIPANANFDRELTSQYLLTVRAETAAAAPSDTATDITTALLVVDLQDRNDFRPTLPSGRFDFSVFENFPVGSSNPMARIFAVDKDINDNSRLTYSISSLSDSPFSISSSTGDLYLTRTLSRAEATSHVLTVTAVDNATLPLSTSVAVTIQVEPPQVTSSTSPILSPGIVDVSEGTDTGELLTTISTSNTVTDTLIFRIVEQEAVVSILPNSGQVYLTRQLDFETDSVLRYNVEVLDGTGEQIPTQSLEIRVGDENDNRPAFTQSVYSFTRSEDLVAAEVGQLVAIDQEDGSNLIYSLVDSSHPSSLTLFNVSSTGLVTTTGQTGGIDREDLPVHTLTVSVTDTGAPPLVDFARVVITIQDVDDYAPQFVPVQMDLYLQEDTHLSQVVHTVRAFDPDEGTNADIAYSLVTDDTPFSINSSGEMTLIASLDAEAQLTYNLVVMASSPSGAAAELSLTVHVVSVLDSPPELQPMTASVRENYPPYTRVTQIESSSSAAPNRQIYYSIVGGDDLGHFLIEPLTGAVRTAVVLDREEVASYQLLIQGAFAVGFESNVTLSVSVDDVNDESPRFATPFLRIQVPENSPTDTPLANLGILDPDDGLNGTIAMVVIFDDFASSVFSIDSAGDISLKEGQELDREGRFSSLRFQVCVVDGGVPTQQRAMADVQIDITDMNDPPEFSSTAYTFTLSIPVVIGSSQFGVEALDPDAGANGEITYAIISGGGTFSIDPFTGGLNVVDNALEENYELQVTATDGGGEMTSANVLIVVRACGFMNLTFRLDEISVQVLEDAAIGHVVISGSDLQVMDLNQDLVDVVFSLPLENPSFMINELTGDVTIRSELDRETQPQHRLIVQANDRGDVERLAQTQVLVTVLDVNESPSFESSYSFSISHGQNITFLVSARDTDEGSNAEISYALTENPSNLFTIDSSTGVITLSGVITGQLGTVLGLVVMAMDRGDPPLSTSVTVKITIVDPSAPRFSPETYTLSIPENTPTGMALVNLTLEGGATGVTFRIVDDSTPFSVSAGGVVSLVGAIDYDAGQRSYQLRVRARDSSGLDGFALVNVEITDSNDIPPEYVFECMSVQCPNVYRESLQENATRDSVILQVSAVDGDSAPNAIVTYSLDRNSSALFSIDAITGIIRLIGELDYEDAMSHTLDVLATDSGTPPLSTSTIVHINVENINDNPPVFRQSLYETSVQDNDQPRPTNLFVSAIDEDDLGELSYSIVPGDMGAESFSVTGNGRIDLVIANPMELSYILNVSAFDGGFYSYTTVLIRVEGINANLPMFLSAPYTGTIPESPAPGSFVVQVSATDADRGTNGQVTYELGDSSETRFAINSTSGVITTTAAATAEIDRETTPTFTISVVARDGGSLTNPTQVSVVVEDINDNAPVFNTLMYIGEIVTVPPGEPLQVTTVLTVRAYDPDNGTNGTLTYSIAGQSCAGGQNIFCVDPVTGEVANNVANPDIELESQYEFDISVSDNGTPPLMGVATTTVVIDVVSGGLRPSFEEDVYNVVILENVMFLNTVAEIILDGSTAIDPSVPEIRLNVNSTRACDSNSLESRLEINDDAFFGIFLVSSVVNLVVTARTLTVRPYQVFLSTTCVEPDVVTVIRTIVNIDVMEVNEPPVFQPSFYEGSVMENESTAVVVTNFPIRAIDPDVGTDGTFEYRLTNNQDKFDITAETGVLITRIPLDFEVDSETTVVTLVAVDMGSPPLTSEIAAIVQVTLLNTNDNRPTFPQDVYTINVTEDSPVGTLVHTAIATDADGDDPRLNYTISGTRFSIGEASGEIRLLQQLDRERRDSHTLEVIASDGVGTTSASLTVIILDSNDEAPVFNQSLYEVELAENFPIGTTFVQVFASDADEGENAIIVFEPVEANIAVNSTTGEVSFLVSPDYEESPQQSFHVRATDIFGSKETRVPVVVRLTDENDNMPIFDLPDYTVSISENRPIGTTVDVVHATVDRVLATDRDSRDNGNILYHLEGPGAALFSITSGDIISDVMFDREVNASIELVVVAIDSGSPPMSSSVNVLVQILDVNDNTPFFDQTAYMVSVMESQAVNVPFFRVTAMDNDVGSNGEIMRYDIVGDNSEDFRIDDDGFISIQNALDHENELRRRYNLTLIAYDGDFISPGSASLVVEVTDVNDNTPVIDNDVFYYEVSENVTVNTILFRLLASDRDQGATLRYYIRNAPELSVNEQTGDVFVATPLDHETTPLYNPLLIASDLATNVTAMFTVNVTNVNDNPPVFSPHNSTLTIQENNEGGEVLASLRATDADSLPASIKYRIESGNTGDAFRLSIVGDLVVQGPLDREEVSSYDLTIVADDNGTPTLSSTIFITVRVLDVNDNSPTVGQQFIYLYLLRGHTPLVSLGTVFVNDSDTAEVNQHVFNLVQTSRPEIIQIENENGLVRVADATPPLGAYDFTVVVTDVTNVPVITTIQALIRNVTDDLLPHSFCVQFSGVTPGDFVDAHLEPYLAGARSMLSAELNATLDVEAISIQDSTFPSLGNTDVTLVVRNLTGDSYVTPLLSQHILHRARSSLESTLNLVIYSESVDVCSVGEERCGPGSTCVVSYQESLGSVGLGSQSITYLGVVNSQMYTCSQTTPTSLCDKLSCPGASSCSVTTGRSGDIEVSCVSDCTAEPCLHGGRCVDQSPGYFCQCPEGYDGTNCEASVAEFEASSYAIFPGMTARSNTSLSLEFNSIEAGDAQLLFNGRFDTAANDSLSIGLRDGSACLTTSRGGVSSELCVRAWDSPGDNQWHTVSVDYQEMVSGDPKADD